MSIEKENRVAALRSGLTAAEMEALQRKLQGQEDKGDSFRPATGLRRRELDSAPLTSSQKRLWFLGQLDPGGTAYNENLTLRFAAPVTADMLEDAVLSLFARHEVLRASIHAGDDGELSQMIAPAAEWRVERLAFDGGDRNAALAFGDEIARARAEMVFDLNGGPLAAVTVVVLGDWGTQLTFVNHHIVSDAWSRRVLLRELFECLAAALRGKDASLPALPLQFADYAAWESEWAESRAFEDELDEWAGVLDGAPSLLDLPVDFPRGIGVRPRAVSLPVRLGRGLARKLDEVAAAHGCTPFMALLAAYQLALHRWSGQDDIVVGSPIANRQQDAVQGLIGFFANTLPLRTRFSHGMTFAMLLKDVRGFALDAYERQSVPLERIVQRLFPDRDVSHAPLVQVLFAFQDFPGKSASLEGQEVDCRVFANQSARVDLSLTLYPDQEHGIAGAIDYNADLFLPGTMSRLGGWFARLLEGALSMPDMPLEALPMADGAELSILSAAGSARAGAGGDSESVCAHRQIADRAGEQPDAVAILSRSGALTFSELKTRSRQVAKHLRARGCGRGSLVGVCVGRSPEAICVMLGVLEAGAAYLPLDPEYPAERLAQMVSSAVPALIVVQAGMEPLFGGADCDTLALPELDSVPAEPAGPWLQASLDDLAYVMCTSGSTGRPKAVMVTHRNVVDFMAGMDERIPLGEDARVLGLTSISFDISVLEIFWPLSRGRQLVLAREPAAGRAAAAERLDFSLFYFGNARSRQLSDDYALLTDGVRYADRNGFKAVWTPERHFHQFGGLFPNAAVTSAMLCGIAQNLQIRAGSVVLPLHNPVRVAEDWAVIDQLSGGRAGVSFATGWHPNDFVLAPENYVDRVKLTQANLETVQALWRGESLALPGVDGRAREVRISPLPKQERIPIWITASGNPETFRMAGASGANLLTHLLSQGTDELAAKIAIYRKARQEAGHDPDAGTVTLMVHTFVGPDPEQARMQAREAFIEYLQDSADLSRQVLAESGLYDPASLSPADMRALLEAACDRYMETKSLIGGLDECRERVRRLREAGVNEIACLIDFGVEGAKALQSLEWINALRQTFGQETAASDLDEVPELVKRHGVTHMQCTPTMAALLLSSPEGREALAGLDQLLIGGEAFPQPLLDELKPVTRAAISNMYGPTEATVWSNVKDARENGSCGSTVAIGQLLPGYSVYVLDPWLRPVPKGVAGEIYIGGNGVARGYLGQAGATAERFLPDPFCGKAGARMYRTGDLAVVRGDDSLSFIGRNDDQVKVRGHRIELGDVEAAAVRCPGVAQAVAAVVEFDAADSRLAVFYRCRDSGEVPPEKLRQFISGHLPGYMVPSHLQRLDAIPQLPNGKADRKKLRQCLELDRPEPEEARPSAGGDTERRLLGLWEKCLRTRKIGLQDNFFSLGGHSLLAAQLVMQIRAEFKVAFPLQQFISTPSIAAQAKYIETAERVDGADGTDRLTGDIAARHEPFPLTDVQQAYWIGRRAEYEMGNVACHFYGELYFSSAFDAERFNLALNQVIARHDMLRAIVTDEGYQRILPEVPAYECGVDRLEGLDRDALRTRLLDTRKRMSHKVHDTESWPLFEIRASLLPQGYTLLHLSIDTIIADGASVNLMLRDLRTLYLNPAEPLPPLQLSFRDYVLYLERQKDTAGYRQALAYWQRKLADLPDTPALPLAKAPGQVESPRFARLEARLDREDWNRMRAIGTARGMTPSSIVLSAYCEVLRAWSSSADFSLCLTVFDRRPVHADVARLVGDFTSLLLLAIRQGDAVSFADRAKRNQEELWEGLEHQQVSAVQALRELGKSQGRRRQLSTPIVFTSELADGTAAVRERGARPEAANRPQDLPCEPMTLTQTPQVWLDHQVSDRDGSLHLTWDAVAELFPAGMLEAMFGAYTDLLRRLSAEPELWDCRNVVALPRDQLAARETPPLLDAPRGRLLDGFLRQAEIQPDAPALASPARSLSYRELSEAARGVGTVLRASGASRNRLVAVVMDRGWEQVVAVLGVLYSGAAYLPIMADVPQERLELLLEDGSVDQVLCQPWVRDRYSWPESVRLIVVEPDMAVSERDGGYAWGEEADLAYVIYTSGSTGRPKGVAIQHDGAVNTIADINLRFKVAAQDRVLSVSSLAFDLSVWDIFGSLSAGACIVLPLHERSKDPWHWADMASEHGVTIWNSVPALMDMCLNALAPEHVERLSALRLIMLSGDWIPLSLPARLKSLPGEPHVISLGGATEASIWSILYPIERVEPGWSSIPYGRAMSNQGMHVLDAGLEPCPDWVVGDLYISGVGLAREYWNNPDKTRESFVHHPRSGMRLYRTGDRARHTPGGLIEFLGREDTQVKVRGNRVELGEIESVLRQHPAVHEAVAVLAPGRDELAVFVQTAADCAAAAPIVGEGHEISLWPLAQSASESDYLTLRSHRGFCEEPIPFAEFSALLGALAVAGVGGKPKRQYPSAGGFYPIQTYALLQDGRVEGLRGGLYRYLPSGHRLELIDPALRLDPALYSDANQPLVETAGFSLFLIASPGEMRDKYGAELGASFCLLEAGYMGQRLLMQAREGRIGLCPIGGLDFAAVRSRFQLDGGDYLAHSLIGGRPALPASPSAAVRLDADNAPAGHARLPAAGELRALLAAKLPAYMMPRTIELIETFPLTANGKMDRAALAGRIPAAAAEAPAPMRNEGLKAAGLIERLLGRDDIAPENSLVQIGIDSLEVIRLRVRIRKDLGLDLSLQEILAAGTVSALEALIESRTGSAGELSGKSGAQGGSSVLQGDPDWTQHARVVCADDLEQSILGTEQLVSASISYLVAGPSISAEQRRSVLERAFRHRPQLFAACRTPLGRIGQIMLPVYEDELHAEDKGHLQALIRDAAAMAGRLGAQVVTLTGMLPSATRYGADMESDSAAGGPVISTGHATTVAAVKLNVDAALVAAGRRFRGERLGILGLGSIGAGALRLLVDASTQPAEILLADVQARMEHLEAIKERLLGLGVSCPIRLIVSSAVVPEAFYDSTLIVGATSVPELLDVDRLRPGTILVDDSFPKCVNIERAILRMRDRQDLLITDAGMLSAPHPLKLDFVVLDESRRAESLDNMRFRSPERMTACVLSSALSAVDSASRPTRGTPRAEDVDAHLDGLRRHGFLASALQLEHFRIPDAALASFRSHFGAAERSGSEAAE
ncbi:amino acid adenylation domain-containing protein [Chromobacterium vaccinii]|uniref:amino acid adenylation domain-containing protein n=1 Tax=Chromobacterium vaccinii TaxID=1108595 RepID=UPI0031D6C8EC